LKAVCFLFAALEHLAQRAMVTLRQLEGAWGAKQTPFVYEKAREKKRGRGRESVV